MRIYISLRNQKSIKYLSETTKVRKLVFQETIIRHLGQMKNFQDNNMKQHVCFCHTCSKTLNQLEPTSQQKILFSSSQYPNYTKQKIISKCHFNNSIHSISNQIVCSKKPISVHTQIYKYNSSMSISIVRPEPCVSSQNRILRMG